MKFRSVVFVWVLSVGFLTGCQSLPAQVSSPAGMTTNAEPTSGVMSLAAFLKELEGIPADATATRLADQLSRFDQVRLDESQRAEVSQMLDGLAKRLRIAVRNEAKALHAEALKAPTFAVGNRKAREAGATIALFPLSEDQKSMEEAEALAQAQGAVTTQLRVIQRKRYNQWAITALQEAQRLIDNSPYPPITSLDRDAKKERWKDAQNKATNLVKFIDPSLLEPAIAPFYQELLLQLGGEDKSYRIGLIKQIVDPGVMRKMVDDF